MALTITCPVCGKRNGYEFRYGGEDKGPRPEEDNVTPQSWCDYVHMNKCVAGIQKEWWFHRGGCGSWFTIYRNTITNLEVEEPEKKSETEFKLKSKQESCENTGIEIEPNELADEKPFLKQNEKTVEESEKHATETEGKN